MTREEAPLDPVDPGVYVWTTPVDPGAVSVRVDGAEYL